MVAAGAGWALKFSLSPGNANDGPEGRRPVADRKNPPCACNMIMDRAYGGAATRKLIKECGFEPVVPPKSNSRRPWEYDRELYKKRNEIERLFRRLKSFRRIFTGFDKLDTIFTGFITFVLIVNTLRLC